MWPQKYSGALRRRGNNRKEMSRTPLMATCGGQVTGGVPW